MDDMALSDMGTGLAMRNAVETDVTRRKTEFKP
ncbi:protein of unknown function [Shinella sp. WSC3-e]|nr:hypothetical protein SHINE37_40525 [Rhizobiaceae bacterium]CAK7255203.1 protein of unknown function [Shinella sp. WSC3-e]